MTIFTAELVETRGHRGAQLTFALNRFDYRPRKIFLVEELRDDEFGPLPFTWRFVHETAERRPIIDVVAAPGVSVNLNGFSPVPVQGTQFVKVAAPGMPLVNIYRVQDPAVLPLMATDPFETRLLGTDEIGSRLLVNVDRGVVTVEGNWEVTRNPPISPTIHLEPDRYFLVDRFQDGVSINHLGTGDEWHIKVPRQSSERDLVAFDALARFAYEIDIEGMYGVADQPLLKIVKTPAVTLTLTMRHRWPPLTPVYWQIWEVDLPREVPPQGTPIVPQAGWRDVTHVVPPIRSPEGKQAPLYQSLFDIAIGFLPIVGDVADIAEFAWGIVKRTDKWGSPLTSGELAIMGLGILLPFVGQAALRRGRQLVRRFGERTDEANELIQRIRQAGLSREDMAAIQAMETSIRAGRHINPKDGAKAVEILGHIPGPKPTVEVLLNLKGDGFAHVQIEEAYRRYVAQQTRRGKPFVSPTDWARRVTSGRPRAILEGLLGPDYARRITGETAPPLNLIDIPRPRGYTDKDFAAHRQLALRNWERLMERLAHLADEPVDAGAQTLGLVRRVISAGRFRIFKGNLAEVFSMPIQRAELRRIARSHPAARLVSGVRVRVMEKGKLSPRRMFSDNLVIVQTSRGIEIHAVFEVKAGFKGGQEATEQIFEWIEGRLTSGSQIIIPKGSTLMDARGHIRTAKRDMTFTWRPRDPDAPAVTNLAGAERHLITAKSTSLLGIDSEMRIGPRVARHELDQNSAQLDFLAANLLSGQRHPIPALPTPAPSPTGVPTF